jgi:hypothetical protein
MKEKKPKKDKKTKPKKTNPKKKGNSIKIKKDWDRSETVIKLTELGWDVDEK